ncbi:unnamed protein product [Pleuronectes platessa]|uniref:Metabotropic glutamate receptor Homer-binding domain-containing protein n=1 Tax=Pleuronectes platessa TaxID=8262 RepID=A0A9N7TNX4_PLEPL|nr:unnamed protein product [Pleuronectes platessa]
MWHRLSVHVKRQDAGSNQMAVIKPLTNTYQNTALDFSNLSTKTLYNVAEEEESDLIGYNPPITPPMMAHGQIPACGLIKDVGGEVGVFTHEYLQKNTIFPQHVIMDHPQEEMVVSKFTSDVPELNDMISMPEAVSGGMPVYHQAHLIQREPLLPLHLDPFDEEPASPLEEDGMENEHFGLLHGYMYNNAHIHEEEDLVEIKLAMDDSLALMPPSPFRDCPVPPMSPFPNSPVSESILCTPPNVTYASVILNDLKQSSSTL